VLLPGTARNFIGMLELLFVVQTRARITLTLRRIFHNTKYFMSLIANKPNIEAPLFADMVVGKSADDDILPLLSIIKEHNNKTIQNPINYRIIQ
jgi:hypothetical protein